MFDALFPSHWSDIQKLMWLKILNGGSAVWDTITGNPVSFSAKAAPLKQLSVAFSPVQDLHGYDSPWPAGGGANQYDVEANPIEQGTIQGASGTEAESNTRIRTNGYIKVSPSTTYRVVFSGSASRYFPHWYKANKTHASSGTAWIANGETFTTPADAEYVRLVFSKSDDAVLTPSSINSIAVNYPATVTTYSPYSNLCPISGWSSLHVYDDPLYAGVIEWNQKAEKITPQVDVKDGITYTFNDDGSIVIHGTAEAQTDRYIAPQFSTVNGHKCLIWYGGVTYDGVAFRIGDFSNGASIKNNEYGAIYTTTGANVVFKIQVFSGKPVDVTIRPMFFDLTQMFGAGNEPATVEAFKALFPKDYYAYNAGTETLVGTVNGMDTRSISINIGQTVYSGYVDVVTGVGEITGVRWDLPTTGWGLYDPDSHHIFYRDMPSDCIPVVASGENVPFGLLTMFKPYSGPANNFYAQMSDGEFSYCGRGISDSPKVYIKTHDYADVPAFTAAINGAKMFYLLATPIPIQLTPQEVNSLAGDNTMWSDANGDLTVEYRSN